jgi:flagellar M-ring protein FliF
MLAQLKKPAATMPSEKELKALAARSALDTSPMQAAQTYQQTLEAAKALAREDPKVVANIVKSWVGND